MKELYDLVAVALKVEPSSIGPETGPLTLSEWDSFNHIHLVVTLEEKYGVEFTPEEIANLFSVGDIASCLREKGIGVD